MPANLVALFEKEQATVENIEAAIKAGASLDVLVDGRMTPLMLNCDEYLSSFAVRFYLKHGADVNFKAPDGNTALHLFLRSEHVVDLVYTDFNLAPLLNQEDPLGKTVREIFQLLLDHGADIDAQDDQGRTPLMVCALLHNHDFFAQELLRRGASPDSVDKKRRTALTIASGFCGSHLTYLQFDNTSILRLLAQRTSHRIFVPPDAQTPFVAAIDATNLPAIHALLEAKYPLEIPPAFAYLEPIAAIVVNDTARFAQAIHDGTALRATSKRGHTPLMWASALGRVEMIRALLDAGANVNEVDKQGWTPLFFAVWQNQAEAVTLLLARGANVNHPANIGWTDYGRNDRGPHDTHALRFALLLNTQDPEHQSHSDVCLLLWNTDRNKTDRNKRDVRVAEMEGAAVGAILRQLLLRSERLDPRVAAKTGDIALVRDIIHQNRENRQRKDIDKEESSGASLLRAIEEGDRASTYYLLATGADLDTTDYTTGKTALMLAAERGDMHLVRTLLEEKADLYQVSYDGKTAVDHAEANGHTAIAAMLWEDIEQK